MTSLLSQLSESEAGSCWPWLQVWAGGGPGGGRGAGAAWAGPLLLLILFDSRLFTSFFPVVPPTQWVTRLSRWKTKWRYFNRKWRRFKWSKTESGATLSRFEMPQFRLTGRSTGSPRQFMLKMICAYLKPASLSAKVSAYFMCNGRDHYYDCASVCDTEHTVYGGKYYNEADYYRIPWRGCSPYRE